MKLTYAAFVAKYTDPDGQFPTAALAINAATFRAFGQDLADSLLFDSTASLTDITFAAAGVATDEASLTPGASYRIIARPAGGTPIHVQAAAADAFGPLALREVLDAEAGTTSYEPGTYDLETNVFTVLGSEDFIDIDYDDAVTAVAGATLTPGVYYRVVRPYSAPAVQVLAVANNAFGPLAVQEVYDALEDVYIYTPGRYDLATNSFVPSTELSWALNLTRAAAQLAASTEQLFPGQTYRVSRLGGASPVLISPVSANAFGPYAVLEVYDVLTETRSYTPGTYNLATDTFTALGSGSGTIADGDVTDPKIGNRTVDQAIATAASNTGTLTFLLSWLAKIIKAITGETNWYDLPAITLKAKRSFGRTTFGDANTTLVAADRVASLTAALTAPRTLTLPSAALVAAGEIIEVVDEAGGIGSTNTLTIQPATGQALNGVTNGTTIMSVAKGHRRFVSDGSGGWHFDADVVRNTVNDEVAIFTTATTTSWTIPANAKFLRFIGQGAGGGGGAAGCYNAGTTSSGGSGASSGSRVESVFSVAGMGWTAGVTALSIEVGAGGAGGVGIATIGAGADGAPGGDSRVYLGSDTYIRASGGAKGNGGATGTTSGGTGPLGNVQGGAGGAGNAGTGTGAGGTNTYGAAGGGGAGGGINASETARAGGLGGINAISSTNTAASGGAATGANGANGQAAQAGQPGNGGGGGGANASGAGGNGGNGTVGGGGGGGGAARVGSKAGDGGAGGPGMIVVFVNK